MNVCVVICVGFANWLEGVDVTGWGFTLAWRQPEVWLGAGCKSGSGERLVGLALAINSGIAYCREGCFSSGP